ncbi:MAG: ATP synthase subunit I [Pseudomonadota bacterium]
MSYAQAKRAAQRKVRLNQALMLGVLVLVFHFGMGWQAAVAVIYGSAIVALNHLMQVRQLRRADRIAGLSPERNLRYLYRCAAERFMATVVMFAAGFFLLRLEPLPLLAGYILGQVALVYQWFLESSARRKHG